MHDCVVVGAGPAGLTAAIYLGRFRRDVLVVDAGSSRAARIPLSRNHPGFPDGVRGRDLLARMRLQAEKYGARFRDGRVERLAREGEDFRLDLAGEEIRARTVLIATGLIDIEPAIPGVQEAVAKGLIRICPICDGYETIGQRVGVIGADAHSAREAMFITTYTPKVALIHVGAPQDLPAEAREELGFAGVELIETPIESVVLDRERIAAVCFGPGRREVFDSLYAALGVLPRNQLAVAAGAQLDESGRLVVGEHQETSIPGLYAAGDVVRGLNQISTAEGEGAIAATRIHNSLREAERHRRG
ncbi:NAD(P)/FAD-dependent oxidoreductase [Phenylobacterium soli]|uniref:Thioredoxin reductase n=1 Tax=Phenylobacterium soli TaxID=2170551 RepID=A0A328AJQ4_9CAUL|nr:NAD(P)/FAD-dependent oxidoreductase [Phenylobacterium soli]RAK53108.1 NAD(P)/FAD-dependent oxidoreductase [Phenylobacterium soli]